MKRRYHPSLRMFNTTQLLIDRSVNGIGQFVKNRLQTAPQFIRRLELDAELEGHRGCVNCLEWSTDGRMLASASDDNHVIVWDPFRLKKLVDLTTPHRGNIFSVKFMPKSGDSIVATGAADNLVYVFDLNRKDAPTWSCSCHSMRVKRLAVAPETPFILWSAGEDGNILQFDLRQPHDCRSDAKILLINLGLHFPSAEAKCLAINPRRPELVAVGANDCYARMYDRRMITLEIIKSHTARENNLFQPTADNFPKGCVTYFCPGHLAKQKERLYIPLAATYITFSPDGTELLVNIGAEQIYLYDIDKLRDPVLLELPNFKKSDKYIGGVMEPSKHLLSERVDQQKKLGNDYLESEKYLQAISQYTEALHRAPECPILYLNRATALMRRAWFGDVYAALRDCHTALKLDPTYIKAHFRLARALLELKHVQEAKECLDELTYRFPSYASNHGVMMLKKDIKRAIEVNTIERTENVSVRFYLTEQEDLRRSVAKDYKDRFVGHCNTTTDIKEANFFGNDANYVIAGSDDGNFFIWERPTNMIAEVFQGDRAIVNCVQPHPSSCLLATSGIDHEIRLWAPMPEEQFDAKHKAEYLDATVNMNQQRMQIDPFDMISPDANCRTS